MHTIAVILITTCAASQPLTLSGPSMGTTYHITLGELPAGATAGQLHTEIESLLARLDRRLSTYRAESEISRFNQSTATDWFAVSPKLVEVVSLAREVSQQSDGAFDVTVAPLVELWGFGRRQSEPRVPDEEEIRQMRQAVGWRKLEVRNEPPALRKSRGDVRVDLNGIAPGYAVDQLGRLLAESGVKNYLIELGGEILASGSNAGGAAWRVGIEQPDERAMKLQMAVELDGGGFSVSGDYRHFFELGGRRYSHILDPVNGRPIDYQGVALAVAADTCAHADAWTKPMLVLGPERGIALADRLGLAVCFVLRSSNADGLAYEIKPSASFTRRFLPAAVAAPSVPPTAGPSEPPAPLSTTRLLLSACGLVAIGLLAFAVQRTVRHYISK